MPVAVEAPTAIVIVDVPLPGAAIDVGAKVTVVPVGAPVDERATALLKPPETVVVMVDVPFAPWTTETEVGAAEIAKLGVVAGVTVRLTVVGCVVVPPVPVTVIV